VNSAHSKLLTGFIVFVTIVAIAVLVVNYYNYECVYFMECEG